MGFPVLGGMFFQKWEGDLLNKIQILALTTEIFLASFACSQFGV